MTKASKSRVNRKAARERLASTALEVAAHGRMIEVEIEGVPVKFWAMPATAFSTVMSALQALSGE